MELTMRNILQLSSRNLNEKYTRIIVYGLIVHIVMVLAAFDLYFASPLDQGMTPINSTNKPIAKRVVLFVADGLRAEAIYGKEGENRTPFLSSIQKLNGSWGVAHTRVPTESRPGHVAMLAGIYEDPSALFKGWKHNPVNFDSVINQSTKAFCWGSPDIINLFNTEYLPHVRLEAYNAEMEDFGKNNTELLDLWVFEKVKTYLKNIKTVCEKNCVYLKEQGNLYFLHLLGIDTAGHAYKPHSDQYINNIKIVDKNIHEVYEIFEKVFPDNSTTYIFTSDHGMTNWGSHGDGSEHETETPVILWGSGIKINSNRQDINQIDLAPFISSLLGVNFPTNSLGIVPYKYLNISYYEIANLLMSNVLQLMQLFNVKRIRTKNNALIFVPFKNIDEEDLHTLKLMLSDNLKHYSDYNDFENFAKGFENVIELMIEGSEYYHYYYQKPILIAVSVGFVFWLVFLAKSIVSRSKHQFSEKTPVYVAFILCLITGLLCYKQNFTFTYYLHFLFPVIMFFVAYQQDNTIKHIIFKLKEHGLVSSIFSILFYLCGIEILTTGLYTRERLSILMAIIAFWVFVSESMYRNSSTSEKVVWFACSLVLSIFPSLPVMNTTFNAPMYVLGFACWLLFFGEIFGKLKFLFSKSDNTPVQNSVPIIQLTCLVLTVVYILSLEFELITNDSNIKYISWILAFLPIILIPFSNTFIFVRLVAIFFGFAPYYFMVSSNFECLFLAFFVLLLVIWLHIECKSFKCKSSVIFYSRFENNDLTDVTINGEIFRRGFLFLVFIFLGFFGTGNIASINSFDPMWVRAFLTVFSPFKMMALILIKIIIPFVFTCCIFRAINNIGRQNVINMFCVILLYSDIMVLQCLYWITNKGSWLEIGSSLSHFLIMEGFVTILLLLYSLSQILTSTSYSTKKSLIHTL